ncbi:unnamed protein product, partial [Brassica oleracea]
EAKVNVEDASTGDEDGGLTKTVDPRLVSTSAKDDVVVDDDNCAWTKSEDSLLATSIANEAEVMAEDEAEAMAEDGAGGRDSTVRPHEILRISKDDDGGGGMIPDSMEAYRDKVEEKRGKDV